MPGTISDLYGRRRPKGWMPLWQRKQAKRRALQAARDDESRRRAGWTPR